MALIISPKVAAKLAAKVPPITQEEVVQCFANREAKVALIDDREDHQTEPPTRWFISETDFGRKLKIAYIPRGNDIHLRSAFPANAKWTKIWEDHYK